MSRQPAPPPVYGAFHRPERVWIEGYNGDAMEPFLTHDGRYLLFNNRNAAPVNTNLFFAERRDDLHFVFRGEIRGVNTPALEGVPTMSCDGSLYFISPRSYDRTFSTVYRAHFADGEATGVELVKGVSREKPGLVNFDVEVSSDNSALYAVDSRFAKAGPVQAEIFLARRQGERFVRATESHRLFELVNEGQLQYAAGVSADQLELFFTRIQKLEAGAVPQIWRSVRATIDQPFGEPSLVIAIKGFAEGPSLSPDGLSLYYHANDHDRVAIFRVTRDRDTSVHGNTCSDH